MKTCNCTTCESRSFERRKGCVSVTLSTVCADDDEAVKTFCLDVTEFENAKSDECVDNEHVTSSVPLDATKKQIGLYLTAALATAVGAYSVGRSIKRVAHLADLSGSGAIPGTSG